MGRSIVKNRALMTCLIVYSVVFSTSLLADLAAMFLGPEAHFIGQDAVLLLIICSPFQNLTTLLWAGSLEFFGVSGGVIIMAGLLITWTILGVSTVCGATLKKPWHIPACLLLCADIGLRVTPHLFSFISGGFISGGGMMWWGLLAFNGISISMDVAMLVLISKARRHYLWNC